MGFDLRRSVDRRTLRGRWVRGRSCVWVGRRPAPAWAAGAACRVALVGMFWLIAALTLALSLAESLWDPSLDERTSILTLIAVGAFIIHELLAIALGIAGLRAARRSRGRVDGRLHAWAGIFVGVILLSTLWFGWPSTNWQARTTGCYMTGGDE